MGVKEGAATSTKLVRQIMTSDRKCQCLKLYRAGSLRLCSAWVSGLVGMGLELGLVSLCDSVALCE